MIAKISRYFHTLRHLKFIQIRYQIWYRIRNRLFPVPYPNEVKLPEFQKVELQQFPNQYNHYLGENKFHFLNIEHDFGDEIDWNYTAKGKLWAYHLNYFDYLHQAYLEPQEGFTLLNKFLADTDNRSEGLEPYPISLRTINWIKFLAVNQQFPEEHVKALYAHYLILLKKTEYHLLGNHLLENGFSFLFGAVLFQDKQIEDRARTILSIELKEQFCKDGAHFELSPMYHVILLQRALDAYNVLIHNEHSLSDIQVQLKGVIQGMVNWLNTIMFSNGDIPMLNDSTEKQALSPKTILDYANYMGFIPSESNLDESGFRKLKAGKFELIADVGNIMPHYQPGHAHSDALNFVMYHSGQPICVDRAISTYEKNEIRQSERSTSSHNTVVVNNTEQSDVWGGFRVGKRAIVNIMEDGTFKLIARHSGYQKFGVISRRSWLAKDEVVIIKDVIEGEEYSAEAHFHFHPSCSFEQINERLIRVNNLTLKFENFKTLTVKEYDFAAAFNQRIKAKKICLIFQRELTTTIADEHSFSN